MYFKGYYQGSEKENPKNGKKCLQIIYLIIRDIHQEYIKNSYNSATDKKNCKWAKDISPMST